MNTWMKRALVVLALAVPIAAYAAHRAQCCDDPGCPMRAAGR
jgi:hypothetical protein